MCTCSSVATRWAAPTAFAVASLLLLPYALAAHDDNSIGFAYLGAIHHGGSGCPQGSVRVDLDENAETLSIFLDRNMALVGPHTADSATRDCNIALSLQPPPGWQYTLVRVNHRGTFFLDGGVKATQQSEYFFQGETGPDSSSEWIGPTYDTGVTFNHAIWVTDNERRWSSCYNPRRLILRTSLTVSNEGNRKGYGYLDNNVNNEGGRAAGIVYTLVWRRCRIWF